MEQEEIKKIICDNIRFLRESNMYKQKYVATIFGVKRDLYAAWEEHRSIPNYEKSYAIADFYKIRLYDLTKVKLTEETLLVARVNRKAEDKLNNFKTMKTTLTTLTLLIILFSSCRKETALNINRPTVHEMNGDIDPNTGSPIAIAHGEPLSVSDQNYLALNQPESYNVRDNNPTYFANSLGEMLLGAQSDPIYIKFDGQATSLDTWVGVFWYQNGHRPQKASDINTIVWLGNFGNGTTLKPGDIIKLKTKIPSNYVLGFVESPDGWNRKTKTFDNTKPIFYSVYDLNPNKEPLFFRIETPSKRVVTSLEDAPSYDHDGNDIKFEANIFLSKY